ncbi:MAG: 2-oxoglutarate dehydrogenase E1 component, partial [Siculibacillus sp.]
MDREEQQLTSFLYGGNAAWIEEMHARYEENPASVDASWREFFGELREDRAGVLKSAKGPAWKRANWPVAASGEMVSSLDGDWTWLEASLKDKLKGKAAAKGVDLSQEQLQNAARDSVRAIMMIRAYRMRGHLHAKLDPLEIAADKDHEELHP